MPTINCDGSRICYAAAGFGEPVVLLHCTGSSSAQWQALSAQLEGRYRVLAPDLHGHGEAGPWSGQGPLTLAHAAALVDAVLSDPGAPVHLIGHSYGGALALHMAMERPERVRSLTLIEPVAFHLLRAGAPAERALYEDIRQVAETIWSGLGSGDYARGLQAFVDYWNGPGAFERLRPEVRHALARQIGAIGLNFFATMNATTPLRAYRSLGVPTLLLAGEHSPPTTRRIAELLAAAMPDAALQVVAGAGHMLPFSHREQVNLAIARHLRQHGCSWRKAA